MIVGLGIDVVELARIAKGIERFGERFLTKLLTSGERAAMSGRHPIPFLAARFAAKEAASKALGTGFSQGVTLHLLEVVGGERGKPEMVFHGAARERADELGVSRIHVSLTHGRDTAAAVVVLER
ncbi:Holo-(acyl-carrier-protein) synthase [Desulfovibrio sp. X2]|uniref:holo-[acyl-carrier-protein] synthase n=1 Tax=Desulfovibrio sp. X2 TaxID=941449 RepID=UPI000358E826|nr:holo-[acyl-carrier-protein] synthase [Desulfovibrio sp. X2]EPR42335.1 Holo-(acyl-carrier-protein) synthase [Desulfovibrio sp. X2]